MKKLQSAADRGTIITGDRRIVCPVCGRPTHYRVRPDTVAKRLPVWCKHCRQESIVNIGEPEPASIETSA